MATKAERFKADALRASHDNKRKKRPTKPPRTAAQTRPAVPENDNPIDPDRPPHNLAPRAGAKAKKKVAYEFELSQTGPQSRKSTRKSPTHLKTDAALRIRATNAAASPKQRAARPSGNPN